MSAISNRILVAYASKQGSTRGIAERIAAELRARGQPVDVEPVAQVGDPNAWRAIVLGSPVYDGFWLPEAMEFMRINLDRLAAMPVWVFSVGSFGDEHPVVGKLMKKEPREMAPFLRLIHPHDYRVFAGVIDASKWPWYGTFLLRLFGGRTGDNRCWPSIATWAATIADVLEGHPQHGAEQISSAHTMTSAHARSAS